MNQPPEEAASSTIEPAPTKPVAWIKSLSERIVRWGDKSDIVKILELIGKFGLVIAVATYLFEIPAQRQARDDALKAKRYQAWALINSAQGSSADGGRRDALQDLNNDGVPLTRANLAKAFLISIKLPKAALIGADLSDAVLGRADLFYASLLDANLTGANLFQAKLNHADLRVANLTRANLLDADLTGANLYEATLTGANLTRANLSAANLTDAILTGANLAGANLLDAKLDGQKQLDEACGSDAKLPTGLTLKPCPPKSSP